MTSYSQPYSLLIRFYLSIRFLTIYALIHLTKTIHNTAVDNKELRFASMHVFLSGRKMKKGRQTLDMFSYVHHEDMAITNTGIIIAIKLASIEPTMLSNDNQKFKDPARQDSAALHTSMPLETLPQGMLRCSTVQHTIAILSALAIYGFLMKLG